MRLYGVSGFKIKINQKEFDRNLKAAIEAEINEALQNGRADCEARIKSIVRLEFLQSPETLSMLAGQLQMDFGFADGSEWVVPIIDWVVNRINVRVVPYKFRAGGKKGGYQIELAVFDLEEICQLDRAHYISDVNYKRDIKWLKWLLSFGSQIIIKIFEVKVGGFNPSKHVSRSGKAIMIPSDRGWRVPSEYSGTISNNWITRTFAVCENSVVQIMEDAFCKHLS